MRISEATPIRLLVLAAAAILPLGLTGFAATAATAVAAEHGTYDWSATLVSFDETAGTAVFEARVESHAHIDGLDGFADGDRLTLVWTGRSWAAGIRDLARDPELAPGTLSLPVEFVASERDGEYLRFRVTVPAAAFETLAAFEPGTRVTAVSPKEPANYGSGVISMRHYNDVD